MNEEKLIKGRKCYDHLGGELGKRLFERLVELEWIAKEEGKVTVYQITNNGFEELSKLGVDLLVLKEKGRP